MPILLRNGYVLTFVHDKEIIFEQKDVLIVGNRISCVDVQLDTAEEECEIVDATNCIVTPGFIDTHRHTWQSHIRTFSANHTLLEYMALTKEYLTTVMAPDDIYLGQLNGCLEALNAGVTCFVDHFHAALSSEHCDAAVKATLQSGVRSAFCPAVKQWPVSFAPLTYDNNDKKPQLSWQLEKIRDLASKLPTMKGNELGRVTLGLADDISYHLLPDLVSTIHTLVEELDLKPITHHCVPTSMGTDMPIKFFHEKHLLSNKSIFSHCNYVSNDILGKLKTAGASISTTPETEMSMSHGPPSAFRFTRAGVKTGLGVDSGMFQSGDLFACMRMALQTARAEKNAKLWNTERKVPKHLEIKAEDVLYLVTKGGAACLNRDDELGAIQNGYLADLCVIRTDSPSMVGATDFAAALVLHAHPSDVEHVIVNGEFIKKDGKLVEKKSAWGSWNDLVLKLRESRKRIDFTLKGFDTNRQYIELIKIYGKENSLSED